MTQLLDRLARVNIPVKDKATTERKIKVLNRAEIFDPRLSRIYYTDLSELPDSVKNHPTSAQRAFLFTFNNWLAKTGDQAKAMRAAQKSLRAQVSHLNAMKRRAHNKGGVDEGLIHWHTKRALQGPQAQIVVP